MARIIQCSASILLYSKDEKCQISEKADIGSIMALKIDSVKNAQKASYLEDFWLEKYVSIPYMTTVQKKKILIKIQ